jgi:D-lactate dehydrogenase (cytochrome)
MDLLAGLGTVLPGDRIISGEEELGRHSGGVFTYHVPVRPDVAVYPENSDEVVNVVRFANEHRLPIVPFGRGPLDLCGGWLLFFRCRGR